MDEDFYPTMIKLRQMGRWHIPRFRGVVHGVGHWFTACGRSWPERDSIIRAPILDEEVCGVCARSELPDWMPA